MCKLCPIQFQHYGNKICFNQTNLKFIKKNKAIKKNHTQTQPKTYTWIADRLRSFSLSIYSHSTSVVKWFTGPIISLNQQLCNQKIVLFLNNPSNKYHRPTASTSRKTFKINNTNIKDNKKGISKLSSDVCRLCSAHLENKGWRRNIDLQLEGTKIRIRCDLRRFRQIPVIAYPQPS